MLRHCPIPRFSSASPRRKMTKSSGKEKAPQAHPESQALELADPKDVTKEPIPPQKVLKIFSINIIAQSLPFCRRRVSPRNLNTTMPYSMPGIMAVALVWKSIVHFTAWLNIVLSKCLLACVNEKTMYSWPEIHIYFHSRCEFALGISIMVISKQNVLHLTFRPGIMPVYTHFLLGKSIFTWHPWFIQYV